MSKTKETQPQVQEEQETTELSEKEQRELSENPEDRIAYDFASDWMTEYENKNTKRLTAYLTSEIKRLIDNGYAVVSSILQMHQIHDIVPKTQALKILKEDPEFSSEYGVVALALVPAKFRQDAIPIHDYNGCLVPEPRRGKVLAAKVCMSSNKDISSQGESIEAEKKRALKYSGPAFVASQERAKRIYATKESPYYCVEIGDKPKMLAIDDAVAVLQRYGHGIAKSRVGKKGLWLVREVKLG